ncbi:MAG: hypothetical protein ABIY55_16465 [Kofleriaceae bacterium]
MPIRLAASSRADGEDGLHLGVGDAVVAGVIANGSDRSRRRDHRQSDPSVKMLTTSRGELWRRELDLERYAAVPVDRPVRAHSGSLGLIAPGHGCLFWFELRKASSTRPELADSDIRSAGATLGAAP